MTFSEAVTQAATQLSSVSDCAKLDAQLLLCYVCNIEQTTIIAHPNRPLNEQQQVQFKLAIRRRSHGEPLAYITGCKEFWSLNLIVNKHVLIPRPETELLVELTLKNIANLTSPQILDLGTGSGAIAVSIAKERKDCLITASDNSNQTLEVANKNATQFDVNISFIHSDWYESIPAQKFDVIISNPPYIAKNDPNLDHYVMEFEPTEALISADHGLEDIQKIISGANHYLSNKGYLFIEHGFQQHEEVRQLFKQHSFEKITTHKDLAGKNRVTSGTMNI